MGNLNCEAWNQGVLHKGCKYDVEKARQQGAETVVAKALGKMGDLAGEKDCQVLWNAVVDYLKELKKEVERNEN